MLPAFSVGGLAGHLARAVLQVDAFLDQPEPEPDVPAISAGRYYGDLTGTTDLESPLNVGVRQRGMAVAEEGHAALVQRTRRTLDRLHDRLPAEPPGRRVTALGRVLLLDEYLLTRLVELTVHVEDLALSLGVETPWMPEEAWRDAVTTLMDAALQRHAAPAVLRALTRRERDATDALRVL